MRFCRAGSISKNGAGRWMRMEPRPPRREEEPAADLGGVLAGAPKRTRVRYPEKERGRPTRIQVRSILKVTNMKYKFPFLHKSLMILLFSISGGVLVAYYLVANDWFMRSTLSIWNPLEWVRNCATIMGVLLGNAHQQSGVGAWIGAAFSSGLLIGGCICFVFLPALGRIKRLLCDSSAG